MHDAGRTGVYEYGYGQFTAYPDDVFGAIYVNAVKFRRIPPDTGLASGMDYGGAALGGFAQILESGNTAPG
jgi:hypothetical protein